MPIVRKRAWKTLELDDSQMADFAGIGGIEIDVLSEDSFGGIPVKATQGVTVDPVNQKKKKKKSKRVVAAPSGSESFPDKETATVSTGEEPHEVTAVEETVDMSEWSKFGNPLHHLLLQGLENQRFTHPTPIQAAVFDKAIEGFDIFAAAETGSGKTLGFGLPIMQAILRAKETDPEPATRCLCVLPTRELAMQVKKHLKAIIGDEITIAEALGGMSLEKQIRVLSRKPDIVVGTPGRIAGLLGLSKSSESDGQLCAEWESNLCSKLSFLVLDEADRLLEQAHFRDLTAILRFIYASIPSLEAIQSFVFSATLPVDGSELSRLLKRLRLKPVNRRLTVDLGAGGSRNQVPSVPTGLGFKSMFCANEEDREPYLVYYLLTKLANDTSSSKVIVFVNAISYVYRLASVLPLCFPKNPSPVLVVGMHSNMRQKDRLKKLDQFSACKGHAVMVATDLAARGLDLPQVGAVVHLQPPRTPESLIHRSGRTARAGRSGECCMIITPKMSMQWGKSVKLGLNRELSAITAIEPVSMDINQVRLIHKTASGIEGETHKHKRDTKNKAWSEKTCNEAELWDSDNSVSGGGYDSDEVIVGGSLPVAQTKRVVESSAHASTPLDELLKNPLPSRRK